jgi:cytochrome oxidase Cu insertion factor (SCO1/SenC/PrrC family)
MKLKIFLLFSLLLAVNIGIFAQKAKTNTEPLQVGAVAPDFTLTSNKDEQFTLSKVDKLTVLVFYRGYW